MPQVSCLFALIDDRNVLPMPKADRIPPPAKPLCDLIAGFSAKGS